MVVHHRRSVEMSCEKILVLYLQDQDHSEDSCNQNTTVPTVSSDLPIALQPNLFDGMSSKARVIGLLSSRSGSQWRFRVSVNVRPDHIF